MRRFDGFDVAVCCGQSMVNAPGISDMCYPPVYWTCWQYISRGYPRLLSGGWIWQTDGCLLHGGKKRPSLTPLGKGKGKTKNSNRPALRHLPESVSGRTVSHPYIYDQVSPLS